MKKYGVLLLCFIALLIVGRAAWAQAPGEDPRLRPAAYIGRLSAQKEPLALDELISAALIFSGVRDADLPRFRNMFDTKIKAVRAYFKGRGVSPVLGDDLLQYMHHEYLRHYNVKQTRMDTLLESGDYNCVSSSVFYLILGRSLGFSVYGVKTVDHAFCTLQIGDNFYDVETTSVFGFNPGEKKEFTDDFGKITGYAYVPPGNYSQRETIGEKELLSLILHNRVVLLLEQKQYAPAIGLAVDSFGLLGDEFTKDLLLQVLSQYASWAGGARRFEDAAGTLEKAAAGYPRLPKLKELLGQVVIQWVLYDIEQARFAEAKQRITNRQEAGVIGTNDYRDLMIYAYQKQAEYTAKHQGNKPALDVIEEGLGLFPADSGLLKSKTLYTYNYIIELVNTGSADQALTLLAQNRIKSLITGRTYDELLTYAYQKQAQSVYEHQGTAAVVEFIRQGMAGLEDKNLLRQVGEMYVFNHIKDLIKKREFPAADTALRGEDASVFLAAKSSNELRLYYYTAKAEWLSETSGYQAAAGCIEEGLAGLGKQTVLVNNYQVYIHNYAAELSAAGEYRKALDVLKRALQVLPGNSVFKKDKAIIERNIN
jgi:tetratricopeptide (TPR) repeat protein